MRGMDRMAGEDERIYPEEPIDEDHLKTDFNV